MDAIMVGLCGSDGIFRGSGLHPLEREERRERERDLQMEREEIEEDRGGPEIG